MILPTGAKTFKEALQIGAECYHALKLVIKKKYGMEACNVGDEGGFAPNIQDTRDGLDLVMKGIKKAGHLGKVQLGMDAAASEFFLPELNLYDLDFKTKNNDGSQVLTGSELLALYKSFCDDPKYPFVTIEDPFD